jgi:putative flavoprotein involved in K+ transport
MGGPADAGATPRAFNRPMTTQLDSPTNGAGAERERVGTLVIGGGQAGLAMAHRLIDRGITPVVVDAHERVGDAWRKRWDSLRVFTPATHDSLPGFPLADTSHRFPTKDEMADYLESYAEQAGVEVRTGTRVERLAAVDGHFVAHTPAGTIEAGDVVIATGAFQRPRIPDFAPDLDPRTVQLHSSQYRNPAQLQDGPVLIVGPGNSGADIAMDLAPTRTTYLAGDHPGHIPVRIETWRGRIVFPVLWRVWTHILNVDTPIGRKARPKILSGHEPLIRVKPKDLKRAGVERTPRVTGVEDGVPVLADGRVLDVPNVIWATGYRPDFAWVEGLDLDERGEPVHTEGVCEALPGLYVLGREFQFAFNSHTIGGVGKDAAALADRIAARVAA